VIAVEVITSAKKLGGSLAVIVPKEVVKKEKISPDDKVRIRIERVDELGEWWGKLAWSKKPTDEIMKIIDKSEDD